MDLKRFDSVTNAETGVEMKLLDPVTKAETGASITLFGADSALHKSIRKEFDARNKAKGISVSPEELSDQTAELLARMTKGWSGFTLDGEELPFSQEKAKEIYKAYPYIADAVATFIFTRTNFFGSASAS